MRVMVIVKASQASEAGEIPGAELLEAMGRFNEELSKAGVLLAGEGLHPSTKGMRVRFSGPGSHRHPGSLCASRRAGRGLLAVAGRLDGRGH